MKGNPTISRANKNSRKGNGARNSTLVSNDIQHSIDAIYRSHAIVEYDREGVVLFVNALFLGLTGYDESELISEHHQVFVDSGDCDINEYRDFWNDLQTGHGKSGWFKILNQEGRWLWMQSTFNPVLDEGGSVTKVIQLVTDVTLNLEAEYHYNISSGIADNPPHTIVANSQI